MSSGGLDHWPLDLPGHPKFLYKFSEKKKKEVL